MRLFLAIFPPKEYVQYFAEVYRKFDKQKRNLKPLPYDQLHLTLRFIGANVSEGSMTKIQENLISNQDQFAKPTIGIENIQFGFARQRDPRHLLAAIKEDQGLVDLNEQTLYIIKNLRFKDTIRWKEKFSNDFHITIARLKETATRSSGKEITKLLPLAHKVSVPEPFMPETFELMESVMTYDGPKYRKLASIRI